MDVLPEYFSLSVGQVSDRDVIAPRTVSFVDEPRTKKLEAEVLAGVANVYDLDTAAAVTAEDEVGRIFRAVRTVQADKSLKTPEEKADKLKGFMTGILPENTEKCIFPTTRHIMKNSISLREISVLSRYRHQ